MSAVVPGEMPVYVNAAVYCDTVMVLSQRAPDDRAVSILLGNERISLEFYDAEALDRLEAVAREGARRLRAAFEPNEHADDDAAVRAGAQGRLT